MSHQIPDEIAAAESLQNAQPDDQTDTETRERLQKILMMPFEKQAGIREVNLRALNPFQRALLVIDGTVTTFLEIYTMEPVGVQRLNQVRMHLPEDHQWLDAEKGSVVNIREVLIQGEHSETFYAYAMASVIPERLPDECRERLEIQGESLGRVLNDSKLEMRREILWYGRESSENLPDSVQRLYDGSFVSRIYRIFAHGKPIALINEKFPSSLENVPSLY